MKSRSNNRYHDHVYEDVLPPLPPRNTELTQPYTRDDSEDSDGNDVSNDICRTKQRKTPITEIVRSSVDEALEIDNTNNNEQFTDFWQIHQTQSDRPTKFRLHKCKNHRHDHCMHHVQS